MSCSSPFHFDNLYATFLVPSSPLLVVPLIGQYIITISYCILIYRTLLIHSKRVKVLIRPSSFQKMAELASSFPIEEIEDGGVQEGIGNEVFSEFSFY